MSDKLTIKIADLNHESILFYKNETKTVKIKKSDGNEMTFDVFLNYGKTNKNIKVVVITINNGESYVFGRVYFQIRMKQCEWNKINLKDFILGVYYTHPHAFQDGINEGENKIRSEFKKLLKISY